jgi:hypothetical protein
MTCAEQTVCAILGSFSMHSTVQSKCGTCLTPTASRSSRFCPTHLDKVDSSSLPPCKFCRVDASTTCRTPLIQTPARTPISQGPGTPHNSKITQNSPSRVGSEGTVPLPLKPRGGSLMQCRMQSAYGNILYDRPEVLQTGSPRLNMRYAEKKIQGFQRSYS